MSENLNPGWADIGKEVIVIATGERATVKGYYGTSGRLVRFDRDDGCGATFNLDELTHAGLVSQTLCSVGEYSASETVSRETKCPMKLPAPPPAMPGETIDQYRERLGLDSLPDQDGKPTNPKDLIGIRKAPMSTISCAVLAEVGVAMLEGAAKYGRHNYRAVGVRASVYYDGTQRHLMDWWEGQDIDPDSMMNHITKAITSLTVLRDAMIQGKWVDDRPPRSVPYREEMNARAAAILDKYADRNPRHYAIADTDETITK